MTDRRTLPGWAIDHATEGIRGPTLTRHDVVKATRQIMLSAHRSGWTYAEVHHLLTDAKNRRLAKQIATGRGGRPIAAPTVARFLDRHWQETAKVAAERPAWSRDDALGFIEDVRDTLDASDLPDQHRAVMEAVIDLASQHGTTRPAVPVREVVGRLGLDPERSRDLMRVKRTLDRLAADGDWLGLAKAGNARTRRANLYNLAPALAATYAGATPPRSQGAPMSHPPMSHSGADPMNDITLTREQIVNALGEAALQRLMEASDSSRDGDADNVVPLRREVS